MFRFRTSLFLTVLAVPAAAWATSNSQIWGTASANIKLSDKWRLSEEVVTRFSDNRDGLYEVEAVILLGYRPTRTSLCRRDTSTTRNMPGAISR